MPIGTVLDLVAEIVRLQVLTSSQRTELETTLAPTLLDPKKLAAELIRRNWLSPFQINYLFAGRTNELILGPYVLLQRLGEGGMGQVYKGMHTVLRRVDAVKTVRLGIQSADTRALTDRFRQEAVAAGRVSHRNLVAVHTAEARGDTFFLGMELLDGTDLGRLIANSPNGVLISEACDMVRQAALGLQAAHSVGLIHRDIKPSNLMLTSDGTVKVLDLGLACVRKSGEDDSRLTRPGAMMGTPDYMPPEQFSDAYAVDERADIYALGCTLYHLLTGKPPFPDGSIFEKMRHHCDHDPTPIRQKRGEVPPELARLIHAMMAKDPGNRPQTAGDVATALGLCCSNSSTVPVARPVEEARAAIPVAIPVAQSAIATEPGLSDESLAQMRMDPSTTPYSPPRSRKWIGVLSGGGVCAIVLVVVLLKGRGGKSKPEDDRPTLIVDVNGTGLKSIREAIAQAEDGMRILIKPGTYRESLVLHKPLELVGDGPVAEIIVDSSDSDCLSVLTSNLIVRGLTLNCTAGKTNHRHAVDVGDGSYVLLDNCRISCDSLAAVVIRGKRELRATLRNCVVFKGQQSGILVLNQAEVLLEDCELHGTELATIETQMQSKLTARRCKMHDSPQPGIQVVDESEAILEDCTIYGTSRAGFVCGQRASAHLKNCVIRNGKEFGCVIESSKVLVEECEFDGNAHAQVHIWAGAAPTLRKCRIHSGNSGGVWCRNKSGGTFEDCEIWGHRSGEMRIEDESDPHLVRCKIYKGGSFGVKAAKGGKGRLEDCDIHSIKLAAVEVIEAAHLKLTRTKIHDNREAGVKVVERGKATITDCQIFGNQSAGVVVSSGGEVIVRGGTVTRNNSTGIFVDERGSADVEGCDLRMNLLGSWDINQMGKVIRKNNQESTGQ